MYGKRRDTHCDYCMMPIDIWQPLNTYNGRCCELYSDVLDIVTDCDTISFEKLLPICEKLKHKYTDIPIFKFTIKEIFDALEDCGIINYNQHEDRYRYLL